MIAKKKTKGAAATKTKSAVKKITKKVVTKKSAKGAIGKKTKKSVPSGKSKVKVKSLPVKSPVTPIVTHGDDLHLIPVKGEIHPARTGEAPQFEKAFKHNEETALHMEQQRAKQIMATTRAGGGKRIFKSRRHS